MNMHYDQQGTQQNGSSDLMRYWRMLRLHRWSIGGFVFLVTLLTVIGVTVADPVYRASTTLLIEGQRKQVVSIEEVYGLSNEGEEYFITQAEILKSRDLGRRVVRFLELPGHPLFADKDGKSKTPEEHLEAVIDKFEDNLTIVPVRNSRLVKINYDSEDPELAALVPDTLARQYIEMQLEERQDVTVQASDWLSERLEDLRTRLQESEKRLQQYREEEQLVDVAGVQTLGADEIQKITDRYVEAKIQRSQAETVYRQIQSLGPNASPAQLLAIPSIQANELVRSFKQDKAQAEAKVSELSDRYGPKHPKMIAAVTEVRSANDQLYLQIVSVAEGVKSNYLASRQTERSLQSQLGRAKGGLQDINRKEIRLRELEEEVETNRNMFNMFLKRAKETEEARGFKSAYARIVDPSVVPTIPVAPKKSVAVLLAVFISFAFASGVALFVETNRNTVRTGDDVEMRLGSALLGFLPMVSEDSEADYREMVGSIRAGVASGWQRAMAFARDLKDGPRKAFENVVSASQASDGDEEQTVFRGVLENTQDHFAESMRSLRTAFIIASLERKPKTILVTSSIPGEGKSTVSLNLAEILGHMEKVLLIDGDLRRPMLTEAIGKEGQAGLAQVLEGKADVTDCIEELAGSRVRVLPAGDVTDINPLELLSSVGVSELIHQLGEEYDRIIIDSPPVHAVSDAFVLAAYANTAIYVVKSDATSTSAAARGLKKLRAAGAHVSGVVLNMVDIKKAINYSEESEHYFADYGYSRKKTVTEGQA